MIYLLILVLKLTAKRLLKLLKTGEAVKSKNYTRKIKSAFEVYADFEAF